EDRLGLAEIDAGCCAQTQRRESDVGRGLRTRQLCVVARLAERIAARANIDDVGEGFDPGATEIGAVTKLSKRLERAAIVTGARGVGEARKSDVARRMNVVPAIGDAGADSGRSPLAACIGAEVI